MKIDHTSWVFGYIIGAVVAFVVAHWLIEPAAYQRGQIDALTGVVKYELVENPDQTREWKRKE